MVMVKKGSPPALDRYVLKCSLFLQVHVSKCDNGCLIFAATEGEGFVVCICTQFRSDTEALYINLRTLHESPATSRHSILVNFILLTNQAKKIMLKFQQYPGKLDPYAMNLMIVDHNDGRNTYR